MADLRAEYRKTGRSWPNVKEDVLIYWRASIETVKEGVDTVDDVADRVGDITSRSSDEGCSRTSA